MRSAFIGALLALFAVSPVEADPLTVSLGVSALLGGAAVNVATVAFAINTALLIGTTVAVNAGITALSKATAKKASTPSGVSASNISQTAAAMRTTTRAGITNRELVLGQVLRAGNLFFEESLGPYLYRGWVIADHEIEGVDQIRIGNTVVPIDANGFPTIAPYNDWSRTFFQVSIRLGKDDQEIDPIIAKDFPNEPRSSRQRGCATVVMKMYRGADQADIDRVWGPGDPQPLFRVKGLKVFDPRDSTQIAGVVSTYKWSRNAALNRAAWHHHSDGGQIDWSDENLDYLREAADACDELVRRRDGSYERRYFIDAVIDTGQDPGVILQDLLTSYLAIQTSVDGQLAYIAGTPRKPVRTLTGQSARGALEANADRAWMDTINTVRTSFVSAEDAYAVRQGPVYQSERHLAARAAFLAAWNAWADGDRTDPEPRPSADAIERSITIDLPYVTSVSQVQRICKFLIEQSELGRTIRRGEDQEAIRHTAGDIVRVAYRGGLVALNGVYCIKSITDTDRFDEFELTLSEYDGEKLFGWNPDVDERDWSSGLNIG